MARELTTQDYRALAEFRYQIRRFLHFSEKAARFAGLNPQQHQLLLALKGLPQDERVLRLRLFPPQLKVAAKGR